MHALHAILHTTPTTGFEERPQGRVHAGGLGQRHNAHGTAAAGCGQTGLDTGEGRASTHITIHAAAALPLSGPHSLHTTRPHKTFLVVTPKWVVTLCVLLPLILSTTPQAISHMGGWKAAAQSLNLHNRRPTPHAWRDWSLDDLAQQLAHFMAAPQQQQQQPQQQALTAVPEVSMQRRRSSRRSHTQTSSQGSNQITRSDPLPVRQQHQDMQQQSHLPTQAQLMSAGRFDLVYSLRQYGYEAVRQHMGLQSRWRKPKIKVGRHVGGA